MCHLAACRRPLPPASPSASSRCPRWRRACCTASTRCFAYVGSGWEMLTGWPPGPRRFCRASSPRTARRSATASASPIAPDLSFAEAKRADIVIVARPRRRARRRHARALAGRPQPGSAAARAGRAGLLGLHRVADARRGGAARRRGGDLPLGGDRPDAQPLPGRAPAAGTGAGVGGRRAPAGHLGRAGLVDRPRALPRCALLRRGGGAAHGQTVPLRRPQRRPAPLRGARAPARSTTTPPSPRPGLDRRELRRGQSGGRNDARLRPRRRAPSSAASRRQPATRRSTTCSRCGSRRRSRCSSPPTPASTPSPRRSATPSPPPSVASSSARPASRRAVPPALPLARRRLTAPPRLSRIASWSRQARPRRSAFSAFTFQTRRFFYAYAFHTRSICVPYRANRC